MAYTASALSFMLENLGKPVVLTGSMLPMSKLFPHVLSCLMLSIFYSSFTLLLDGASLPF